VYGDRIVFAIRRTEVNEAKDILADVDISRVWFSDVAYGRCSATGFGGLERLDATASSEMFSAITIGVPHVLHLTTFYLCLQVCTPRLPALLRESALLS